MSHKRIVAAALAVFFFVLAAAGCGGSSTVATVGKQKITKKQFDAKMVEALGSSANAPKPGSAAYKQVEQQVVEYLVQTTQRDLAAAKMGVQVTGKQVAARIAMIRKQDFQGSEAKLEAALKKAHTTVAQMRDDVRQQLIDNTLKARLTKNVKVSNADVKAYYLQNKKTLFSQGPSRGVRHILLKTKKQAEQLYAKLRAGADFASYAKKYSTDTTSAAQGGKMTIGKGQTVAPFDKVAFSLKTGEISPPVHTIYGWHIIQALSDVKPGGIIPLRQVASEIRQQLLQSKQSSALANWMQKVARQYKATYAKGDAPSDFASPAKASSSPASTEATTPTTTATTAGK